MRMLELRDERLECVRRSDSAPPPAGVAAQVSANERALATAALLKARIAHGKSTPPESARANGLKTALDMIIAPKEAFEQLRVAPTWGWALLILLVLYAVAS